MSRHVIVWTPNYGIEPFEVVHDSEKCGADLNKGGLDQIIDFYKKKGEDSDVKHYLVEPELTNRELLKVLNMTMEIATSSMMAAVDKILRKSRKSSTGAEISPRKTRKVEKRKKKTLK